MAAPRTFQPPPLPNRRKFLIQLFIDVVCFFTTVVVGIAVAILIAALAAQVVHWFVLDIENVKFGPRSPAPPQHDVWIDLRLLIPGVVSMAVLYVVGVMSAGVRIAAALRKALGVEWFWDDAGDGERNT